MASNDHVEQRAAAPSVHSIALRLTRQTLGRILQQAANGRFDETDLFSRCPGIVPKPPIVTVGVRPYRCAAP